MTKEIFNARECVHRLYRGSNRASELYEVEGDFFYCRSREEAERELKEAGELLFCEFRGWNNSNKSVYYGI